MSSGQLPCNQSDLAAYLVRSEDYGICEDGKADLNNLLGECEVEANEVDEYHCLRCKAYWPVENRYDDEARYAAWQAAFAHLDTQQEQAA